MFRACVASAAGDRARWQQGAAEVAHSQVVHEGVGVDETAELTRPGLGGSRDQGTQSISVTELNCQTVDMHTQWRASFKELNATDRIIFPTAGTALSEAVPHL